MSEKRKGDAPLDLGIYGRPVKSRISTTDIVAAVLSVIWIGAIVAFFMVTDATGGTEPLTFVFTALAILLPLAMIWVAATVAKTARVTREEAARLQAALDAMRHTYVVQQQTAGLSIKPSVERKLDEIAETARKTEVALTTFASRRGNADEQEASAGARARARAPSTPASPSSHLRTFARQPRRGSSGPPQKLTGRFASQGAVEESSCKPCSRESLRACSSDSSRHVSITHKKAGGPAGARGSAYSIVV